jgi:hypothetical protein
MTVQTLTEQTSINTAPVANGAAGRGHQAANGAAQARFMPDTGLVSAAKAAEVFSKAGNEAVKFSRGNLEALALSTQVYLAGAQNLSRLYVQALQGLAQHAVEGTKALGGIKTVQEALSVQANLSRNSLERAAAEGAKLQQATLEMAKQVYAPLAQRVTVALEQTKPLLAA